eukprot:m.43629 g.43629  ORF g.43629 m.43629 type:complete len:553 (-) comp10786_c0_seq1:166-1824(-)
MLQIKAPRVAAACVLLMYMTAALAEPAVESRNGSVIIELEEGGFLGYRQGTNGTLVRVDAALANNRKHAEAVSQVFAAGQQLALMRQCSPYTVPGSITPKVIEGVTFAVDLATLDTVGLIFDSQVVMGEALPLNVRAALANQQFNSSFVSAFASGVNTMLPAHTAHCASLSATDGLSSTLNAVDEQLTSLRSDVDATSTAAALMAQKLSDHITEAAAAFSELETTAADTTQLSALSTAFSSSLSSERQATVDSIDALASGVSTVDAKYNAKILSLESALASFETAAATKTQLASVATNIAAQEARLASMEELVSFANYGHSQGKPGTSCLDILEKGANPTSDSKYWIDPNGGSTSDAIQVLCDMATDGGGWTLVASNAQADTTFPRGTSRCNFFLHRTGYNDGSRASVSKDYLIGPQIDSLSYSYGRLWIKSGSSVLDVKWLQNNHRQTLSNNGINQGAVTFITQENFGSPGCGSCNHMNLDAQLVEGSCNSNTDQRTIGAVCTQSCPDPYCGTYLGHGNNEANSYGEGAYYAPPGSGCGGRDTEFYATYVR